MASDWNHWYIWDIETSAHSDSLRPIAFGEALHRISILIIESIEWLFSSLNWLKLINEIKPQLGSHWRLADGFLLSDNIIGCLMISEFINQLVSYLIPTEPDVNHLSLFILIVLSINFNITYLTFWRLVRINCSKIYIIKDLLFSSSILYVRALDRWVSYWKINLFSRKVWPSL